MGSLQHKQFSGRFENGVFEIDVPIDNDGGIVTIELSADQAEQIARWMLDQLKPKKVVDASVIEINNETFGRFWAAYPKKVGKTDARAAWANTKAAHHLDAILADIDRRKDGDQWKRGYILDPVRYIRSRRWEDSAEDSGPSLPQLEGVL